MTTCPYRKIRPLGEGAVGDVYLCVDLAKRRLVVVKWLRAEIHEDSEASVRFQREAQLMSGTRYDGVIKVEEFGVDEYYRTWMSMEFVDGVSPAAAIPVGDVWSIHRLMEGIGRGLDVLHSMGVVHRDLKPDNILLRDAGGGWEPVIIDLGIAKWVTYDAATSTGSVFGTPHYMSPEQFRDTKHVGPATDRYALAVIVYELLTGRLPFDGRSLPELLQQHMEVKVPPLGLFKPRPGEGESRAGTPTQSAEVLPTPALDAFMARAMGKLPEQRFDSGIVMARAFRDAAMADGIWVEPDHLRPLFGPVEQPMVEIRQPGHPPLLFDIRQGPVVIGRHESCQAVVSMPRMSRLHACVYQHRGGVWLGDLHSQNGTQFQGRPVVPGRPIRLPTNDQPGVVRLYDHEIEISTFRAPVDRLRAVPAKTG